jgi:hypothetical protein
MFTCEINQGIKILNGLEIDVAAPASIATIGSAFWDEFFTPKAQATMATISGYNLDLSFIYKHSRLFTAFIPI